MSYFFLHRIYMMFHTVNSLIEIRKAFVTNILLLKNMK